MDLMGNLWITGVEDAVSIGSSAVTIGASFLGILGLVVLGLVQVLDEVIFFI